MTRLLPWLERFGAPLLVVGGLACLLAFWPGAETNQAEAPATWTCSMHPQLRKPAPGECDLCGMDLVPVAAIADPARQAAEAGYETEAVAWRELYKEIRAVGKLDYNEARIAEITARIAGRVDRVYADFTGVEVQPKDHLVDLYSPDLYVAQSELIRAVESAADRRLQDAALESARTKLRLLGVLPEQIVEIEKSRKIQTHLTVFAPLGGTVIEKSVRAGQYVKEGDVLYKIANLDPLWLYLDIYESELAWVRYGQQVDVHVEAYPGEVFRGAVVFINPFLDDRTRTVKVRVNLANPDRRLKPAMYASATIRVRLEGDGSPAPTGLEGKHFCPMHPDVIRDQPGACDRCGMKLEGVPPRPVRPVPEGATAAPAGQTLAVPATAVLDAGDRQIAYRQKKPGEYELVELKLGSRAEGKNERGGTSPYFVVLSGLQAGDQVVARGGFLLDSQRQIEGQPSLFYAQGLTGANLHAGHGGHAGHGAPSQPKQAPASPPHQHDAGGVK